MRLAVIGQRAVNTRDTRDDKEMIWYAVRCGCKNVWSETTDYEERPNPAHATESFMH